MNIIMRYFESLNTVIMKTISKLEDKLSLLKGKLRIATDPDERAELEEKIDFIQDEIEELIDAEQDQDAWEEMTGTRPQDLYDDRNSYAIRQGEMFERFRNEH
jgi:hypothetical protein